MFSKLPQSIASSTPWNWLTTFYYFWFYCNACCSRLQCKRLGELINGNDQGQIVASPRLASLRLLRLSECQNTHVKKGPHWRSTREPYCYLVCMCVAGWERERRTRVISLKACDLIRKASTSSLFLVVSLFSRLFALSPWGQEKTRPERPLFSSSFKVCIPSSCARVYSCLLQIVQWLRAIKVVTSFPQKM